jgi:hypothetical protein
MTALIAMIPEQEVGTVLLVNHENSATSIAVTLHLLDAYTHGPRRDWIAMLKDAGDRSEQQARGVEAEVAKTLASARGTAALPLQQYAGSYRDNWRGDASVRVQGDRLVLKIAHTDALEGVLQPYGGNVFVVRWNERALKGDAFVRFIQGYGDSIEGMTLQAVSPATDSSLDFQDLDFKKLE